MMRQLLLCAALAAGLAGCGNGNIGDLFGAFPAEVFSPPSDDGGGGGTPPPGGGVQPTEVIALEAAQNVTGDVRNIARAQVNSKTLAVVSAGVAGLHVIDATRPDLARFRITVPGTALAGGACDALAVVDNTYLVSVAVGSSATNAVTVIDLAELDTLADTPGADPTVAIVAPVAGSEIAVPGKLVDGIAKAGGVSGATGVFAVATGGSEMGVGRINTTADPVTWEALAPLTSTSVIRFLDVFLNAQQGLFATVEYDNATSTKPFNVGIVAAAFSLANPDQPLTLQTPTPVSNESEISNFATRELRTIYGPGNYPADLAFDGQNLYVTGDREVRILSPSDIAQAPQLVADTGTDTVTVTATQGVFVLGRGDSIAVYSTLGTQPFLTGTFSFPAIGTGRQIRGVSLVNATSGSFALCCAGTRGVRVVQFATLGG